MKKLILVRPEESGAAFEELCKSLETALTEHTEWEYTLKVGKAGGCATCTKAAQLTSGNTVAYLWADGVVAVAAQSDLLMRLGVQRLLSGVQAVLEEGETLWDASAYVRDGWLQNFPAYTDGELDPILYSDGTGQYEDEVCGDIHVVRNTTRAAFDAYVDGMVALGYRLTFENVIDGNRYANLFDVLGNNIYVYYMTEVANGKTGVVRTVCDRSSVTMEQFSYTCEGAAHSAFYLFNHNSSGENTYLIHAADNSWIFIDGGVAGWRGSDPEAKFSDWLFRFMCEKSGVAEGEKLVISSWYLTHAHRDHFLAFQFLLEKHHDRIDLQRIIANVPDLQIADHNTNMRDFRPCREAINRYYPKLDYLKVHPGMKFKLADVEFEVLIAQENLVDFWTSNREVFYSKWIHWHDIPKDDPDQPNCRHGYKKYDINNSSIVSKITVNGMTVLELGDAFRAGDWILPYYTLPTMTCDVVVTAHHFINDELMPFYRDYIAQGTPVYMLVNNINYAYPGEKGVWKDSFREDLGQHLVTARYDTVFGFRKVNGKVEMTEDEALYSFGGEIDKL